MVNFKLGNEMKKDVKFMVWRERNKKKKSDFSNFFFFHYSTLMTGLRIQRLSLLTAITNAPSSREWWQAAVLAG